MTDNKKLTKSTPTKKGTATKKKMKVVGKETYINRTTGEVQEMQVIKMEDRDFNFDKIWLVHILESLNLIGGQKMKVMTTLLKLKNRDNLIITTQKNLCQLAEVSRPIVSETIKLLIESNFLKKKQNGVYFINPDMLFNGGKSNRMNIKLEYFKNDQEIKETQIGENPDIYLQEETKQIENKDK